MKKIPLNKNQINDIIHFSETIEDCIVNLYKKVIPDKWEDILEFHDHPITSRETSIYILEQMGKKFGKEKSNLRWLDRGFSSTDMLSWIVLIPDNCYELIKTYNEDQNIVEGFAQVEVEEFGNNPDYYELDQELIQQHDKTQSKKV